MSNMIGDERVGLLFGKQVSVTVEIHPFQIVQIPIEVRLTRRLRDVEHPRQARAVRFAFAISEESRPELWCKHIQRRLMLC